MDKQNKISCEQAKAVSLISFLSSLGYSPSKTKGDNYWYLSPIRSEKTPSFKVSRKKNLWFDHGIGKGGTLIDFGQLYYKCSISELLQRLADHFSFHQHLFPSSITDGKRLSSNASKEGLILALDQRVSSTQETAQRPISNAAENRVEIIHSGPLQSLYLERYLHSRNIPLNLAKEYCQELSFSVSGYQYLGIGFKSDLGGYEIRNEWFKGSSAPKSSTYLKRDENNLLVFEGFFDFLSLLSICKDERLLNSSCLVLNSLSFIDKVREILHQHPKVHLFLDNDLPGRINTEMLLDQSTRFIDQASLYKGYKDVNEWVCAMGKKQHQRQTLKPF